MNTFTIKVNDNEIEDICDCQYFSKPVPRIMIDGRLLYLTREICEAGLRELAKRSNEGTDGTWTFSCDRKKLVTVEHTYTETWLKNALWELCKVKYQPIPITDKERIEKAKAILNGDCSGEEHKVVAALRALEE